MGKLIEHRQWQMRKLSKRSFYHVAPRTRSIVVVLIPAKSRLPLSLAKTIENNAWQCCQLHHYEEVPDTASTIRQKETETEGCFGLIPTTWFAAVGDPPNLAVIFRNWDPASTDGTIAATDLLPSSRGNTHLSSCFVPPSN
ncbi:hypothetical protein A9K55_002170 [Cordyceps militaris]|uniref:Uncharacterized protein n=1 Tax=Cordyceps militaris TaxID=73501 RepID=A0A2H4ST60_CORMI|nr:hypothetical protein A9K55_002170 [Cordyceps militaris]